MRDREEATVPNLVVEAIVQVLEGTPATAAILYGSRARGDATADSDIDIAIEFEEALSSTERTRARLGLIERLTTELKTDRIDVVPLSQVSAELFDEIASDGILLYGSTAELERGDRSVEARNHRDRVAEFDDLLAELERVV